MNVILIGLLFIIPIVLLLLKDKFSLIEKIGCVSICYILGFIISLLNVNYDRDMCENIISTTVVLAIPLMLFSVDIKSFLELSKKTLSSFLLMIMSVFVSSFLFVLIGNKLNVENSITMSSMAVGLYVGGTQNLFALGQVLANNTINNLAHIADSIIGGIYLLFLEIIGIKIYKNVLKDNDDTNNINIKTQNKKFNIFNCLKVLVIGFVCVAIGILLEYLINKNLDGSLFIILTITILGIALSFIKPIREIQESNSISEYLIIVFSLGLGMSMNFKMVSKEILLYMAYFGGIQILAIIIHFIICKIFKIDGATAIITSVASIYGPPFVATIAKAYKKEEIIAPGILCGTMGLAIGNILGLLFNYICVILL